jgi:hypothetical protein
MVNDLAAAVSELRLSAIPHATYARRMPGESARLGRRPNRHDDIAFWGGHALTGITHTLILTARLFRNFTLHIQSSRREGQPVFPRGHTNSIMLKK